MTVPGFKDHFSGHASAYAAHRPGYPPGLIHFLADLAPGRARAWDAGTGSGQAAVLLADHFEDVLATDASPQQIGAAEAHPRVRYEVAGEDGTSLATASVDLVTVAQALHWFDLPRFYAEVRRVAKLEAVIAAWCYGNAMVEPAIDAVVEYFYDQRLGDYWPPERRRVDALYGDMPFPFPVIPSPAWSMQATWSRGQLLAYIGTWSAIARARQAGVDDILPGLRDALAPLWSDDPADTREVHWPIGLLLGRVAPAR